MAGIECGRGHLYDPAIYAACPYCNSSQQAIHFGGGVTAPVGGVPGAGVPVGSDGKTAPIGGMSAGGGAPMMSSGGPTMPIGGAVGGVSVSSDGHTQPPKGYQTQKRVDDEGNKTIGMLKKTLGIDPVVGWLVCVEGAAKGKDFRIKGQINTIGKGKDMDIRIEGDDTISAHTHARLGYSEKTNRFHLIPADSKNIIYLNGDEVYAPVLLKPYDRMEFGQTTLLFIPFCGEGFQWTPGGENHGAL